MSNGETKLQVKSTVMTKQIFALLILVFSTTTTLAELSPFTSDGCSVFPDGTLEENELWMSCCVEHDKAYWLGGTREQRLQADEQLKQCVDEVGEPEIALLMLAGVRVGGSPFFPTKFRWAYGWPYLRGYKALTEAEREGAKKLEASGEILSDQ